MLYTSHHITYSRWLCGNSAKRVSVELNLVFERLCEHFWKMFYGYASDITETLAAVKAYMRHTDSLSTDKSIYVGKKRISAVWRAF